MRLDQVNQIMLGDREVSRVYLGANLVGGAPPAYLFAQGEHGVWYDPSDLSTLYQDAAGTVPVTAVEQPVGLMLDKSKRLMLGPELVTNGTFDTADSWTLGTGWSIANGVASYSGNLYSDRITQARAGQNGKTYKVTLTFTMKNTPHVNARVMIQLGGTGQDVFVESQNDLQNGQTYTLTGYGTPTNVSVFEFRVGSNLNYQMDFDVDNISVRELPGNHAYQPTATSRPVLSARYNLLTKTEQLDDALAWGSNVTQLVDGQVDAPDGTNTAFRMSGKSGLSVTPTRTITVPTGALKFSVFLRHISGGAANINTLVRNVTSSTNLVSTHLGQVGSGTSSYGSWTKTDVGNGWFRIDISVTSGVNPSDSVSVYLGRTNTPGVDQVWDVWHPDLRALADANLPYQWVNSDSDYDTVGFPYYLRFDGVDDHLNLGVLNMSAASTVGYFGAITKLSDASSGRWYSHSLTTTAGSVRLLAPANPGQASVRTGFYSSSGLREVGGTSHAAPITVTVKSEIEPGGDGIWITHNNGAKISTSVDPTGFSADGEACIGAQVYSSGGRSNYFNGRLYSLIIVGRKSNISEQSLIESFLRRKSKAY